MKKGLFISMIVIILALVIFVQCNKNPLDTNNNNSTVITGTIYGGSDPRGDLIAIAIDSSASTVARINYTTGETNGPYTYSKVTAVTQNGGFSIINKADIGDGKYVYFAVFPNAACVYQLFNSDGSANGNPQYAVSREAVSTTDLYGKAYNWMHFKIDTSSTNDDMNAGFASFDSTAGNGVMIGAGYSHIDDLHGEPNGGVSDINSDDSVKLSAFTYNSNTMANSFFSGGTSLSNAFSLIGTASGTMIIDFGMGMGGGSGLAIPQAASADFQSAYAGKYLLMIYEYDSQTKTKAVNFDKCAVDASGNIKVFHLNQNTATASTNIFSSTLIPIATFATGPDSGNPIKTTFQSISGCESAISSTVQSAYLCHGGFIATNSGTNVNTTVNINFDPNGNFLGFTGFSEWTSGSTNYYNLMFGFGIKDSGYSDSGL